MHLSKKKIVMAIEMWNEGEHSLDQIAKAGDEIILLESPDQGLPAQASS